MTDELLNEARANYNQKKGSEEYTSSLPQILLMIDTVYNGKVGKFSEQCPMTLESLPNLETWNVHYDVQSLNAVIQMNAEKNNVQTNGKSLTA